MMKTRPLFTDREKLRRAISAFAAAILVTALSRPAALAQCPTSPSWNGYCCETTPRTREQRLTAFQYKASHNSYDRSESLREQIDDYNCWMLELDCWWQDGDVHVHHLCSDISAGPTFVSKMEDIASSYTAVERFTLIYLELKLDYNDNCSCGFSECCKPWPAGYRNAIRTEIQNNLDMNRIYQPSDWIFIDNYKWPSYQELVRRGKNWAIIIDERCTGDGGDYFFFEVYRSGSSGPETMYNEDGGCNGGGSPSPVTPTDRDMYRAYPGSSCAGLCSEQDGGYWNDGVANGFNFIATNCVDGQHTFDDTTIHSPAPMYVAASGNYDHNWGTNAFPYVGSTGLLSGVNRVSPMVPVLIDAGTYDISASLTNQTISRPMVLKASASGALVTIR